MSSSCSLSHCKWRFLLYLPSFPSPISPGCRDLTNLCASGLSYLGLVDLLMWEFGDPNNTRFRIMQRSWGWAGKIIEAPGTSLLCSSSAILGNPATLPLELQVPSLCFIFKSYHCLQDIMKKKSTGGNPKYSFPLSTWQSAVMKMLSLWMKKLVCTHISLLWGGFSASRQLLCWWISSEHWLAQLYPSEKLLI